MKLQVIGLDGQECGEISLDDSIFGVLPRKDYLSEVVRWQLACRQAGTHDTKTRGEINRTKKKLHRQKGTGGARHGAKTANIFRGGGIVFGPTPRSHAFKLNKKMRNLALRSLLSLKLSEKNLIVCEDLSLNSSKTKDLLSKLNVLGVKSGLFIDDSQDSVNFKLAASNVYGINILPSIGFNVYDGLRHEKIVLTKSAVIGIQQRLLG